MNGPDLIDSLLLVLYLAFSLYLARDGLKALRNGGRYARFRVAFFSLVALYFLVCLYPAIRWLFVH